MTITIEVTFLGAYQRLSGKKRLQLKLEKPSTVKEAIIKLTENVSDELKRALIDTQGDETRPNALILVGGKEISALQGLKTEIKESQEMVLVPMVHGG
jgi:molybdopterin converting factor small subunit